MSDQRNFTLYQGAVSPSDIILQPTPVADVQSIPIFLYNGAPNPNDILLADPTFLPVFAVGKIATGLVGQIVAELDIPLTGQAATGAIGSLFAAPSAALVGQVATCTGGTLIPEIDALPAGRVATTAQGAIVPYEGPSDFVGQRAITAQGALTPSPHFAGMVGQRATTAGGIITPEVQAAPQGVQALGWVGYGIGIKIVDDGPGTIILHPVPTPNDIILYPTAQPSKTQIGVEPLAATGVVFDGDPWFGRGPRVDIGGTGSVAANPGIEQHQSTFSFTSPFLARTNFYPFNGFARGPNEQNNGIQVLGFVDSLYGIGGLALDELYHSSFQALPSTYPVNGVNTPIPFPVQPTSQAGFQFSAAHLDPAFSGGGQTFTDTNPYSLADEGAIGGWHGIDPDGNEHVVFERSVIGTPTKLYYVYQKEPEFVRSLSYTRDNVHDWPMGVVGIADNNCLIFYPSQSGTDWVPTYVQWNGSGYNSPVQLTGFTGAAHCFAIQDCLCTVYSKYDDTAYIFYLSGANATTTTPSSIGAIVMNLRTLTVVSHTLTAVPTAATTWNIFGEPRARMPVQIPVARSVRLSSGTNIAQFMLDSYVIRVSWTSSSITTPTITLKNGPTSNAGSLHYLVPGWESLEVRGDDVFHLLYDDAITGGSNQFHAYSIYSNDATGTGSTWNLSSTLWSWTELSPLGTYKTSWWSASGDHTSKYRTWLLSVPHADSNWPSGGKPTFFNTWAWLRYWDSIPAYLTVTTEGRVGNVTLTIVNNEIDVALTGLRCTATANQEQNDSFIWLYQGAQTQDSDIILRPGLQGRSIVPAIAVNLKTIGERLTGDWGVIVPAHDITAQLVGQAATGTAGQIVAELDIPLTGQSATAIGGVFSAFDVNQALTGLAATATGGVLIPELDIPLTGQAATGHVGTIVPEIQGILAGAGATGRAGSLGIDLGSGLTGLAVVSGSGGLVANLAVPYNGLRATTGAGGLVASLLIPLQGDLATGRAGSVVALLSLLLTGKLATLLRGSMGLIVDAFPHVTGVQAEGHVGTEPVTDTNVPPVPLSDHLWARSEIEKLFATVVPEETATVMTSVDTTAEMVIITLYNDEQPKE